MSIIAKCPDGLIRIFCKGADSVICERLAEGQDDAATMLIKHMDAFGEDGLRTLCVASAIISNEDYEAWDKEYQAAALSLYDREDKIDDVSEKIEKNLTLLGSTAIEDKLQDQVPESIYKLSRAGIKIWVLTGDKVETALNIGFSCNLLKRDMNLILIKMPSSNDSDDLTIRQQMERALENFWGMTVKYTENSSISFVSIGSEFHPGNQHALIIDGAALKHALETDEDRLIFWYLATKCNSVLCCRVSPLQKAKVVELVKQMGGGAMCLAIGDGMICELTIGANDVGMIQAAHIGVGISGQEGLQAVMSSDYAIGQFKHLTRLLIVHGHWSYIRTAEMILCFFFKNLIYVYVIF